MSSIEYIVIVGYLLLLLSVGWVFRAFSNDTNDFLRGGCKGTWWLVVFLISTLFSESKDETHRDRVKEFFRRMHTPIDFKEEVGSGNDIEQLRIIGRLGICVALFILCLLFIPNPLSGRVLIVILAASIAAVSSLMIWKGQSAKAGK